MLYRGLKRISDATEIELNTRLQGEYASSYIYRAMSNWCGVNGLFKAKDKFTQYANEELVHAQKLTDYIIDRNAVPNTACIEEIPMNYISFIDVLRKAYEHEVFISNAYIELNKKIFNEGDQTTYGFLQWFVNEQIEEENKFNDVLTTAITVLGVDDSTIGIALKELEDIFAG